MIEFGKSLRAAREAQGLTIRQLAETTHMVPTMIENLENEDFSRIAAPIYGRGFVKLYCAAVGLDPKPFVDEFMEILNGNRTSNIRERAPVAAPAAPQHEVPVAPEQPPEPIQADPIIQDAPPPIKESIPPKESVQPEPPPMPAPIAAEPPPAPMPEPVAADPPPEPVPEFHLEAESVSIPKPAAQSVAASADDLFSPQPTEPIAEPLPNAQPPPNAKPTSDEKPSLSRYATPVHQHLMPDYTRIWRLGALAAAAIVFIGLLIVGIRALYRATAPAMTTDTPSAETTNATPPSETSQPAAPVTQKPTAAPAPATPAPVPPTVSPTQDAPKPPRIQQTIPALYLY